EIRNQSTVSIKLKEDSELLDEVVVVGYGTVKKSDLTGSVASVSDRQFKDQPIKRVEDILQGRTPGVEVTALTGMPGESIKVRIRGTTSINKSSNPLYVIDGIVSSTGLDGLNPLDIQSIEVLKDASATAIYGSRGANGVVLVTTRKGQEGRVSIVFDASVGISNMAKKYDLLNAYEYALALNDMWGSSTIQQADLEAYKNGIKGVDWQSIMTQIGIAQDYKLSISGGNEKNRYLISGNILDMTAVTITSKYKRYQFRINLDSDVTPWLNISTRINAARMHSHNNSVDLMTSINYSPAMEMKNEETGVYNSDPYNAVDKNPYGSRLENYNDNYRYYLNGNVNFLFKIAKGLTFSVQGGLNYEHAPSYSFISSLSSPGVTNKMGNTSNTRIYWQNTNNLTYQKELGDHNFTATAVWEASNSQYTNLSISGSNLSNEIVGYWNVNNAKTRSASNNYTSVAILSGIARLNYSYKGKYMLTGTIRADGASKFQKGNKWGYFPSVALAWDIAKESFMDENIFQRLKLRTSYGVTGNQDIDAYSTLGMLSSLSYGWGTSNEYVGYWGNSFATPNVSWETTNQYDIGADISVLDSRLNLSVDWFHKRSKDLLFKKSVPQYNGGGSYWVNEGEVKNSGVELMVSAIPVDNNGFIWETTFNASHVKNKVVDLAGSEFLLDANFSNYGGAMLIKKPGYPLGSFYLYKWRGFDDAGANLYEKKDGTLTTNPTANDQFISGQSDPKWTFGWNNMFTWKNWTASIFINAATGFNRLNMSRYATASMTGTYKFITLRDAYFKGWDKVENKADALYPSYSNSNTKYYANSDFWLENASFLKVKNVSIAYMFPKQVTKFADVQLSFSVQNLLTITKYSGMDPEVYNGNIGSGIDSGAYPVPRTFTIGAKFRF
ncbi:TonB-dependent receptor, partial [Parabacteroides sp. AF17-28]|uniref:SusC/RagA family TonB-linked outer membrane protein n=2 Tax=Parabacteroides TaxID=375288 RepID=UPI000FF18FA8